MQSIVDPTPQELAATSDPFLRWQLGSWVRRMWIGADARVAYTERPRPDGSPGRGLVATGDPGEQVPLLALAVDELRRHGLRELRLSTAPQVRDGLPATLVAEGEVGRWEWMLTDRPPSYHGGVQRIDLDRPGVAADLAGFLALHNPTAHAGPDDPDAMVWLGRRERGVLVCAGAACRNGAGIANLRAITVRADRRGEGWGRRLTAALTAYGLAGHPAVSLGHYSDNAVARGLYERLGYVRHATFASSAARLA